MNDEQIKHMVNRFLGWRLPENFSPDAGISFKPEYNVEYFIEAYLERAAHIQTPDGHMTPVRSWSVATAATGSMRDTIDLLMSQRGKLQNG